MRARLTFVMTLGIALVAMLGAASASSASPANPRILITTNISYSSQSAAALAAEPAVAGVDTFDTSGGTPDSGTLASHDVVAGLGDSTYDDPVLWGGPITDERYLLVSRR